MTNREELQRRVGDSAELIFGDIARRSIVSSPRSTGRHPGVYLGRCGHLQRSEERAAVSDGAV